MGTINVSNFSGGMDRTRPIYALDNGRLWVGENGHITRGGDFEKRKSFVESAALGADTFGLASDGSSNLYVFGSVAAPVMYPVVFGSVVGGAVTLSYVQLISPGALAMTKVVSVDWFAGKHYVVAEFAGVATYHFYDGAIVADWHTGASRPATNALGSGGLITYKRKVYGVIASLLYFSSYDFPTQWLYVAPPNPGAGFLNMSNNLRGNELVTALGIYKDQLAIFSKSAIQLWTMNNDPTLNAPGQIILGTGTSAKKSVIGYGDYDVIYLSGSGIRSLRAVDYGGTATVQDLGTPIDTYLFLSDPTGLNFKNAIAAVEPIDGRLWMSIGDTTYVYSYFPGKKIAAWTTYTGLGCSNLTDIVTLRNLVFTRDNTNKLYMYGGENAQTYDYNYAATAQLPFMSMGDASGYKQITGVDAALTGTWDVNLLFDPNDLAQKVSIGTFDKMTYGQSNIGSVGYGTHIAPKFVSAMTPGNLQCSISAVALHYLGGERDTGSNK